MTGATRHGTSTRPALPSRVVGRIGDRSAGCWGRQRVEPDERPHRGRACDLFATTPGRFLADGADLADRLALGRLVPAATPERCGSSTSSGRTGTDPGRAGPRRVGAAVPGGGVHDIQRLRRPPRPRPCQLRSDGVWRASRLPLPAAISRARRGRGRRAAPAVTFLLAPNRDQDAARDELDGPARRALDARPSGGCGPLPADPAIDLTDPEAVAQAYLVAAGSVVAADAGRTTCAAAYAAPGSPPATVGTVLLDPPPARSGAHRRRHGARAGSRRRSTLRRGYLASISTCNGALTVIDIAGLRRACATADGPLAGSSPTHRTCPTRPRLMPSVSALGPNAVCPAADQRSGSENAVVSGASRTPSGPRRGPGGPDVPPELTRPPTTKRRC